jgi:hypothetical protein
MPSKALAGSVHYKNAVKAEQVSQQLFQKREERRLACPISLGIEVLVTNQATARALESNLVSRLAKFFPEATPVRIPIKLSRTQSSNDGNASSSGRGNAIPNRADTVFFEDTVIEFGTPHEMLFTVDRPLEFADQVLVESDDGSLRAEGSVVAVQHHPHRTAVAVRFLEKVPNWIVKS